MSVATFLQPDLLDPRLAEARTYSMLVGGENRPSEGEPIEREAPGHAGRIVARFPRGSARDVDAAVAAARAAFDHGPWPGMPAAERARAMLRVAALMERDREQLATIEAIEAGKPITQARAEINGCIDLWEYAAGQVRGLHGEVHTNLGGDVIGMVMREPVGVVGVITPWNFPLVIACERIPWVIGAGATMVIKPSEFTSGTTLLLGELIREAGVPAGVVNVVTGYGDPVGDALTRHPGVDMISFTGSVRVGRIVGAAAAATVKRVGLELGGKGPQVVFADADLDAAADGVLFGLLFNNGQCCISGSRLIVHSSIAEGFTDRLVSLSSRVVYGNPLHERTMVGSIINDAQIDKIANYVEIGQAEGAHLRMGGNRVGQGQGLYFEPTIFTGVEAPMKIANDEIFGPVLSILTFDTPEDAIRLANGTEYGLSASVWTRDLALGLGSIRRIRAGKTWINGVIASYPEMPFGGFKQSGNGRETGKYGFDQYSEFKTVHALYGQRDRWIKADGHAEMPTVVQD